MKLLRFSILILCLLSSVMSFADDITYTVSTSHGTYSGSLSNMTDGNTSTYWWSSDAQSTGSYVLITFSEAIDLTTFSTYSSSSTDYPTSCNELQVSSDGNTWTSLGTFQDAQTSTFSDFTDAKNIKYVRIYASSSDTHWLYINEITMSYTAAVVEPEQVSKTYSRSNVSLNTWESFCLPMNVELDELQKYFDKIYIPKNGEQYDIYDEPTEGGSGDISGSAKPMLAARKVSADGTSTITCTAEAYSEEDAYWTEDEEAEAVRCCFAYSASGSKYYHFFIADYSDEVGYVIPQGTPFFAHIKSNATLTDNSLTLNGYLEADEKEMTGIVDKSFKVYSDQSLTTVDTDKSFDAVGELTADESFSVKGTLYAINTDGSFSATTNAMQQNHAYLMVGADDAEIILYPTEEMELINLKEISVTDPDEGKELHLTDAEPDLVAGTYKAGNLDYTRTVNNYYAGFYVPFDVDLSTMTDNFQAVYVPAGFATYNPSTDIITMFLADHDMTTTLPAYTPFLAVMTTDETGTYKSQDVCLSASSETTIDKFENQPLTDIQIFDYGTNGGLATTSENYTLSYGGTLVATTYGSTDGYWAFNGKDGSFGDITSIRAFRAIVRRQKVSTSSSDSAKLVCVFINDDSTDINEIMSSSTLDNDVYSIDGRKLGTTDNFKSLPHGIYVVNGKKIIK